MLLDFILHGQSLRLDVDNISDYSEVGRGDRRQESIDTHQELSQQTGHHRNVTPTVSQGNHTGILQIVWF